MLAGPWTNVSNALFNLLNLPGISTGGQNGVAFMVNEAGDPIDAYGRRISVPGRYDRPKKAPAPVPLVAPVVTTTPAPVKRREVLAMPQPRIAGEGPKLLTGIDRARYFQQFSVRGR